MIKLNLSNSALIALINIIPNECIVFLRNIKEIINSKSLNLFLHIHKIIRYKQKFEKLISSSNRLEKFYLNFLKEIHKEMLFLNMSNGNFDENDAVEFLGIFMNQIFSEKINKIIFQFNTGAENNNDFVRLNDGHQLFLEFNKEEYLRKTNDSNSDYKSLFFNKINQIVII